MGLRAPNQTGVAWVLTLVCVLGFLGCAEEERKGSAPDVLLVTLDTLRSDWVQAYGFAHANTPSMDGLASRGVLFENAIAAASLTAPSHASVMTGRYVREHSVGTLNGESRLEGLGTLAERFEASGYETAAFISNVVLRRRTGLDRGFDVYDDNLGESEANRPAYFERRAQETVEQALAWLAEQDVERPVFVWLHLQDPHGPYEPPEGFEGRIGSVPLRMRGDLPVLSRNQGQAGIPAYQEITDVRDPAIYAGRYAEEIMYSDFWLGRFIDAFESHSAARDSVILLTADHGESLGEHGFFFQHGQSVLPELVRVPLIVVAPGISPGRVPDLVSHVDVAPTLLDLAGLPGLSDPSGLSLSPLLVGESLSEVREVFSDTEGESALYGPDRMTRVLGPGLATRGAASAGPLRSESLTRREDGAWRPVPTDAEALERISAYLGEAVPPAMVGAMTPEHIEQLRALGYLDPEVETDPEPDGP